MTQELFKVENRGEVSDTECVEEGLFPAHPIKGWRGRIGVEKKTRAVGIDGAAVNLAPSGGVSRLLTSDEVAAILKVSKWAVCSYVRGRRLHATRFGKGYRFTPEMVKRFIELNRTR